MALPWDTVINDGKSHDDPIPGRPYLLPMRFWNHFNTARFTSDTSGSVTLRNFLADGTYALQFDATGIVGMDFH